MRRAVNTVTTVNDYLVENCNIQNIQSNIQSGVENYKSLVATEVENYKTKVTSRVVSEV